MNTGRNLTAALVLAAFCGPAMAAGKAALVAEAKALMMEFGGALKAELVAGVEAGGPVNAISVCNTRAPEIAATMSSDGWSIGRSSHRLRNPENAADPFTAATIEDFLTRSEAGESFDTLARAEIVEENGQQVFRLVKAIETAEVCLACHGGDNVNEAVVGRLAELYPDDQARNFALGDMRGVFTLSKVLE
ncbi:MAG: DUF3365 domain-containing protein [Rhodobacteraceae bacterium]|nr:DUF3365 domain-containing protein [Paracoccaceae bacterium]